MSHKTPEARRAYHRAYRKRRRKYIRRLSLDSYYRNKKKILARRKKFRQEHPEVVREWNKKGMRNWRAKHRDAYNRSQKQYREKNKEKLRAQRKRRYAETYDPKKRRAEVIQVKWGLTTKMYQAMSKSQKHRCAICGCKKNGKHFAVDHCHKTEKIRGLLCSSCNLAISHFKENIAILKNAILYLKKHQAP
jgi:hypothetical protein